MHLKRTSFEKELPLPRKGSTFLVVASHERRNAVPLLVVMRELLGLARTRKEARQILLAGDVKVNNKVRKDEKFPLQFFDVVEFEKLGKAYRLEIVNKKFRLKEVSGKEKDEKIVKIVGKKIWSQNLFLLYNCFHSH